MTWRPTIARWRGNEGNRLLSVVFSPPPPSLLLHQLSDKEPLQNSDGRIQASAVAHYASSFVCCCRHHSFALRKVLNCCHCCVFNLAFFFPPSLWFLSVWISGFPEEKKSWKAFRIPCLALLVRGDCLLVLGRFHAVFCVWSRPQSGESKARSVMCFHEDSSAVDSLSVTLSSSPLKF